VGSFRLDLNHRLFIDDFLAQECGLFDMGIKQSVVRLLDKWEKLSSDAMRQTLSAV